MGASAAGRCSIRVSLRNFFRYTATTGNPSSRAYFPESSFQPLTVLHFVVSADDFILGMPSRYHVINNVGWFVCHGRDGLGSAQFGAAIKLAQAALGGHSKGYP